MIAYPHVVTLVKTDVDGYGTEIIDETAEVACVIELGTGYLHGDHQDAVTSDAIVRPDPDDSFVQANFNRLEEMLVIITMFDTPETEAWYKVQTVDVYMDTQLSNTIDNIQLGLKKTTEVQGVS